MPALPQPGQGPMQGPPIPMGDMGPLEDEPLETGSDEMPDLEIDPQFAADIEVVFPEFTDEQIAGLQKAMLGLMGRS